MTEKPRQLPLDLPVETRFDVDDFLLNASNEAAYSALDAWPDWSDAVLILTGPPGAGKSHLAAIWAEQSRAVSVSTIDLTLDHVPVLVSKGALVLEDCDRAGLDEEALFHLVNACRERKTSLLLTARSEPSQWPLQTADLVSRLRLAPLVILSEPDDALLGAVLVKLFVDRQIIVDTAVVDLIRTRIERSIGAARDFVARIDREGLARSKRITRAFVADLIRAEETKAP